MSNRNRKNKIVAKTSKGATTNYDKNLKIKKKKTVQPMIASLWGVIIILCIGFLLYAGYNEGWFVRAQKAKMTMGDWSTIEVDSEDVEISDEDVDDYIDTFVASYDETEEETEGTVEDGDTVTITYVGYYDEDGEKGEEFDGGSDEDYELEIGSDEFIDGFEDGLIGVEIGDTVDLSLTFPDDYDDEDMAGVDVIFEVTVSNRIVTVEQELTDDFVSTNSEEYWGEQIDTVEDLEDWVYDYYYTEALHSAILTEVQDLMEVKQYDGELYETLYDATEDMLEYYADAYGYDADTLASYYGSDDAESYCTEETEYYCEMIMLMDYFWDELGFEDLTDEEIEDAIYDYMVENGYEEDYTVDEFIEANGDAWYETYVGIELREEQVLEALEAYTTVVDSSEDETETSEDETAEETEAESE